MLDNDKPQKYSGLGREELRDTLLRHVENKVNFIAIEWDFPKFEAFPDDIDIHFLTCLRDPLARAISNFRFAKIEGRLGRSGTFSEYMNGSAAYRSHNYYCRMICNNRNGDLNDESLDYSLSVLKKFDNVVIAEKSNLAVSLEKSGLDKFPDRKINSLSHKKKRLQFSEEELAVSTRDRYWFVERNAHDYLLYSSFLGEMATD